MKKITKHIFVSALIAVILSSTAFAQEIKSQKNFPQQNFENTKKENKGFKRNGFNNHFQFQFPKEEDVAIGKVKSINTNTGIITIINADSKEESFAVTPFTLIMIQDDSQRPEPLDKREERKPSTIADLYKGDWVLITTFDTNTKTQVAEKIFSKAAKTPEKRALDNANAK